MQSCLFILFFLDNLDSTIASPVGELIETPLPEITLAVVEAYPFRTSRQHLELWCTHVIRNDLDHTLKFDETRGIARVKNVHTLDRVIVFSTSDVRMVKRTALSTGSLIAMFMLQGPCSPKHYRRVSSSVDARDAGGSEPNTTARCRRGLNGLSMYHDDVSNKR